MLKSRHPPPHLPRPMCPPHPRKTGGPPPTPRFPLNFLIPTPKCSSVPASQCSSVPAFQSSGVPAYQCSSHSSVPVFQCSSVPVFQPGLPAFQRPSVPVLQCSRVPVFQPRPTSAPRISYVLSFGSCTNPRHINPVPFVTPVTP